MRNLHRIVTVVVVTHVAALAACGPGGNDLGLEGTYAGALAIEITGTVTATSAADQVTNADADTVITKDSTAVVQKGYGVDATLSGLSACALSLVVSGETLALGEETVCVEETTVDIVVEGTAFDTSKVDTFTFEDVTLQKSGDDGIAAEASGTFTSVELKANDDESETDATFTITFDGVRVGGA